jgi:UDP-N-acetylmuramoyl-tripeptide--D-alanyl-D-alanine ligase
LKLKELLGLMEGTFRGSDPAYLEKDVRGFCIDSRQVGGGDVFFALSQPDYSNNCFNGEFSDSHVHIPAAFANGATAAVVRADRFAEHRGILGEFEDRLIFSDDCILAMQRTAAGIYRDWNRPVVGVTGSAGKTTAKELIALVLSESGRKVLRNKKNFNNGIGLPLTVFELMEDDSYEVAVLEMGMSTPNNEIQRLCRITPPDFAVELCVLPVHVEHLGSIENVAKAKAELVEGMKPEGTAILNSDDFRVLAMAGLHDGRNLFFGLGEQAQVTARDIDFETFGRTRFKLVTPSGEASVEFPLNGRHNIMNALAAASVGHEFGMSPRQIADALAKAEPPTMRGEVVRLKDGITLINDSYNSNPDALLSMVETLCEGGRSSARRVVVAGEMRELGPDSERIHHEIGMALARYPVDVLYAIEGHAAAMMEGAKDGGLAYAEFFENSSAATEKIADAVKAGDLILVKGSRGVRTEKIVERIIERHGKE